MRVLCLHGEASSALQFSQEFHQLEERLWKKHGIELVFVDGPLLDMQLGDDVGEKDGGINAMEEPSSNNSGEHRASRRWYVKESKHRALPPTAEAAASQPSSPSTMRYSGLDASLLHLSQIWTRGGVNTSNNYGECLPFQGVLGIGQGADVGGLLPMLNYHNDDGDSDDEKENVANSKPTMFQGLQCVILIDGKDIVSQRNNENADDTGDEELENDLYVGPDGIKSLHIITEQNENANDGVTPNRSSEEFAKKYGPNAAIHHCKQQSNTICTASLSNVIGKFLVAQKNELHSNSTSRELMSLQTQLSTVERLATLTIAQEIQRNPPKALMAVIGPAMTMTPDSAQNNAAGEGGKHEDKGGGKENVKVDKAVGAWNGARRRAFGEEGGGAPCPGGFLLKEEAR